MNRAVEPCKRLLSLLLSLCLLLTAIPTRAESPATPADLWPAEAETELLQEQGDAELPLDEEAADDPNPSDELEQLEALEEEELSETQAEQEAPETEEETADTLAESEGLNQEEETFDSPAEPEKQATPYLAEVSAGSWLYADSDCYRRLAQLAEDAVVLVAKAEDRTFEVLYAHRDENGQIVPGKAFVKADAMRSLTEEKETAWLAAEHPDAVERLGFQLEPVIFGSAGQQGEGQAPDAAADEEETPETEIEEEAVPVGEAAATPTDLAGVTENEEAVKATGYLEYNLEEEPLIELADQTVKDSPVTYSVEDGVVNASYVAAYQGLSDSQLPAIRNQNPLGSCWAFAAIGAMEIALIKQGLATKDIDLSELFLLYYASHNYAYAKDGAEGDSISFIGSGAYEDNGGNFQMAYRTLANIIGTVNESDASYINDYDGAGDLSVYGYNGKIAAQISGAYRMRPEDISAIKQAIIDHGAVSASIWSPLGPGLSEPASGSYVCYRSDTNCLVGGYEKTNHAVLLVGWDDNFPASSFGLTVPGNGAWRVRNSWGGSGEGLDGYYWLSYYDASLASSTAVAYDAVNNQNGEEIADYSYSYDKTPVNRGKRNIGTKGVVCTSFTITGQEKIQAVGVETGSDNVRVTVEVNIGGKTVASGAVTAKYEGFYRVKLNQTCAVSPGTAVEVVVTHTSVGENSINVLFESPGTTQIGDIRYTAGEGGGFTLNGESVSGDPMVKLYTQKNGSSNTEPTKIALRPTSFTLNSGSSRKLTATVDPSSAAGTELIWTSSDASVAVAESDGTVYSASDRTTGTGTAIITAMAPNGVYATSQVTVYYKNVPVTGLRIKGYPDSKTFTINESNANGFTLGSTLTLETELTPKYPTNKGLTWISSNPSVMTVQGNENGTASVKVLKSGTATITVTADDKTNGTKSDYLVLTVDLPIHVSQVWVNYSQIGLYEGDGFQLTGIAYPENATNRKLVWTSSNPAVATVSSTGYVRGIKDGTAVITATVQDNGMSSSCKVIVVTSDPIEAFVYRMYRVCLQREPDPEGLQSWVRALRSGEATGAQIAYGFYNSAEMIGRRLSNENYVSLAYQGIMGREADAEGRSAWAAILDSGMSYCCIISGFTRSNEFTELCGQYGIIRGDYVSPEPRDQNQGITTYVSRLYTKMQGRGYDEVGLNSWCAAILAAPTKETLLKVALNGFMHSVEFESKGLSDTEFVKVLYRTFLDRECDPAGLQAWCAELQSGHTRDEVAAGFAYSTEFAHIMARFGF